MAFRVLTGGITPAPGSGYERHMNRRYFYVGAAIAIVVLLLVNRQKAVDHEVLIRGVINDTIAAAEAQDLGGMLEHVSDRFRSGEMDKRGVKGLLFLELRRGAWRKIFLTSADIEVEAGADPKRARVILVAVLATGKEVHALEDVVPTNAGKYRFDLTFEREDEQTWRVTAATHERVAF